MAVLDYKLTNFNNLSPVITNVSVSVAILLSMMILIVVNEKKLWNAIQLMPNTTGKKNSTIQKSYSEKK